MQGYEVEWLDRAGRPWWLNRPARLGGVRLLDEGLELSGRVEDATVAAPGVPGHQVDSQIVEAMTGSLSVMITRTAGETIPELLSAFRAGWSTAPRAAGTLSVLSPRLGRLSARVRLAEALPAPGRNSTSRGLQQLTVPIVADRGLWTTPGLWGTGQTEVSNMGDTTIYPHVSWLGAGGDVVLPSGAVIELPPTGQERIVYLDPSQSGAVTDVQGQIDPVLWRQMRAGVLPEGIPPAEQRTVTVPHGAVLHWIQEVADPWT